MKVIKNTLEGMKSYTFKCRGCESELEALPADFKRINDQSGDALICNCPVCGMENWLSTNIFSKAFLHAVKR